MNRFPRAAPSGSSACTRPKWTTEEATFNRTRGTNNIQLMKKPAVGQEWVSAGSGIFKRSYLCTCG